MLGPPILFKMGEPVSLHKTTFVGRYDRSARSIWHPYASSLDVVNQALTVDLLIFVLAAR
jgi:hypothetical protein